MNTLAYILLCVLLSKPRSGYELKQLITIFWEAHHSQIYTTLAKLDQHSQKKIYHLTDEGRAQRNGSKRKLPLLRKKMNF